MKRICSLLLLSAFICAAYAQNKVAQKNTGKSSVNTGSAKIANPFSNAPLPYVHAVDGAFSDKAGNMWFATTEGFYRYNGKSFTNYKAVSDLDALAHADRRLSVTEDNAGRTWFGAQGEAVLYNGKGFTNIKMIGDNWSFFGSSGGTDAGSKSRDPEPYVTVFPDKAGTIWFVSGFNLLQYDENSQSAIQTGLGVYLKTVVLPVESIRRDAWLHCLYQDRKGNIWFSISGCSSAVQESWCLDARRAAHPCILNKCHHDMSNPSERNAHNKEIAASLTKITKADGASSLAYMSIQDDSRGNVWLGTWDSGVYRYDGKSLTRLQGKDGLGSSAISVIYEDKAGSIWFGTGNSNLNHGNGLYRYDPSAPAETSLAHFTTKDGLCNAGNFRNNIITAITEDNAGHLWVGGDGGISRYDPSARLKTGAKPFTSLTKSDGFNEQPVNCMVKDKMGNLWIGTWDLGLYRHNGTALTSFTENTPKI